MRILCGFYLFFPPGYVAFGDSKTPHRPADERVSWCLETSPPLRLLPQKRVSIPNSFVSLFIFYILSYLLSKTMGCLSGCLVSSASVQKLCCGICSAFKLSFDEFVGEKVVSLSYYSTILGLHLIYFILNRCHHFCMHYCDDFPLSLTLNQSYLQLSAYIPRQHKLQISTSPTFSFIYWTTVSLSQVPSILRVLHLSPLSTNTFSTLLQNYVLIFQVSTLIISQERFLLTLLGAKILSNLYLKKGHSAITFLTLLDKVYFPKWLYQT